MFEYCDELSSFTIELPKLTDGEHVFYGCTNLKSFTSKLPKLTNGFGMFEDCKLDKPSVINILTSIPQCKSCISISTGYDYTKDEDTLQAIKEAENKGWEVEIEYNH